MQGNVRKTVTPELNQMVTPQPRCAVWSPCAPRRSPGGLLYNLQFLALSSLPEAALWLPESLPLPVSAYSHRELQVSHRGSKAQLGTPAPVAGAHSIGSF